MRFVDNGIEILIITGISAVRAIYFKGFQTKSPGLILLTFLEK